MRRAFYVLDGLPPTANRLWRHVRGRPLKSAEFRHWLEWTGSALCAQGHSGLDPKQPYRVHILLCGLKFNRDADNCKKPVLDALVHAGVVPDDRWMCTGTVERCCTTGVPHTSITVTPTGKDAQAYRACARA